MVNLRRHQVIITGIPTGPGVSTFYTDDLDGFPAMLQSFYFGIRSGFQSTLDIQVLGEGAVIDDATGNQVDQWSEVQPALVEGLATGDYAAGVGAVVTWRTAAIVRSRVLRGRNFLVPLNPSVFDTLGTLDATYRDLLLSSSASLIQDANMLFRIWSRPVRNSSGQITEAGSSSRVLNRTVNDKVAMLTSRRD